MSEAKEKKSRFFNKNTTILTIVCVVIITIVGTCLLNIENENKSVVIKSEQSAVLQSEIDKVNSSGSEETDKYNPEVHGLININTADKEALMVLDGIGEKKAEAIIEYRSAIPFKNTRDILNVSGIGEKTYEKIKDEICVE